MFFANYSGDCPVSIRQHNFLIAFQKVETMISRILASQSFSLVALLYAAAALAVVIFAIIRRREDSKRSKSRASTTPTTNKIPTTSPTQVAIVQTRVVPRRKLFLTWAAVEGAIKSGAITEVELDQCLFCTSVAELNLADEYNSDMFTYLHPFMTKALREGRMICYQDDKSYNPTTLVEVNELLTRNGISALSCYPDGTLEQIPIYSCVPSVADGSVEVLWAAHPLRGDWKRCWGRTLEQIEAEFEGVEDEVQPKRNWMQEMNQPIIDELKRKHEPKHQQPADESNDGEFTGGDDGESEDPADFWKKGKPQD